MHELNEQYCIYFSESRVHIRHQNTGRLNTGQSSTVLYCVRTEENGWKWEAFHQHDTLLDSGCYYFYRMTYIYIIDVWIKPIQNLRIK